METQDRVGQRANVLLAMYKSINAWQAEIDTETLIAYLRKLEHVNDFQPQLIIQQVQKIDQEIPRKQFNEGNLNNGKPHHKWIVGLESSEVLYLKISKFYMPKDYDYTALTRTLSFYGSQMLADNKGVTVNEESSDNYPGEYIFRFWWD